MADASSPRNKTILVTGGTGLIGSAVHALVKAGKWSDCQFIFSSSSAADLTELQQCRELFHLHKPTHVLHLAVCLAGIREMSSQPLKYYLTNSKINRNVLEISAEYGVTKVVSVLSTAMFPETISYPVNEADILNGKVHPQSEGYGDAKRELEMLSRWYSSSTETMCVCILASNVFGSGGSESFRSNGPMVNALIRKCYSAALSGNDFHCLGKGIAMRQVLFNQDLAPILIWALFHYEDSTEPMIVAGEEVKISNIVEAIVETVGFSGRVCWEKEDRSVHRRTASIDKLNRVMGAFEWTPLKTAIEKTYKFYTSTYCSVEQ